jgi:hypothetical protein
MHLTYIVEVVWLTLSLEMPGQPLLRDYHLFCTGQQIMTDFVFSEH